MNPRFASTGLAYCFDDAIQCFFETSIVVLQRPGLEIDVGFSVNLRAVVVSDRASSLLA